METDGWRLESEALEGGRVLRFEVRRGGVPTDRRGVLRAWQADEAFRDAFLAVLRDCPFDAYYWETPAWTEPGVADPFEFVLADAPRLTRLRSDPGAFAEHFRGSGDVASFASLGRDAWLVAPCPRPAPADSGHLATFSRTADRELQHELWITVGRELEARLSATPLWLSTSGLGVPWLHVRIDSRPKYYTHGPYRAGA